MIHYDPDAQRFIDLWDAHARLRCGVIWCLAILFALIVFVALYLNWQINRIDAPDEQQCRGDS